MGIDPAPVDVSNVHSSNRYAYANNNPYRYVDPTGEIPLDTLWDAGNVVYDLGKITVGWTTGNQAWVVSGGKDLLLDAGAMALPYVPAGMQKIGREVVEQGVKLADKAGDVEKAARAGARATTDIVATRNGLVNVRSTLDRMKAGEKFPHRNDGSVFQNREGLLPKQADGYYREFVHPTPGVNGPGAQRIIQGQNGELYYSPDHYGSFIPLN